MSRLALPVRLLLLNQFAVNTGFYMLIPYLAVHLGGLGMSAAVIGVVLGVRTLSQQGLFLLGGTASDRLGPRTVILAGCALRAVGFGLFAIGDSLAVVLAASVLSGLAGALFNPAVRAYIALEAGEARTEAFARFNVYAQAGALFGPVLGSVLLLWDFRVSAVVAAGIFAALTVAQALVLPARPATRKGGTVLGDWRECLANRRFVAFTCVLSGMFVLQNQLYLLLPIQAQEATGSAGVVAALFIVSTVATLLFQVRITRLLSNRARGPVIAAGLAVMGAGFAVPALWSGLVPVLVATLALAVGVMIANPLVYDLIPSFGPESLAGTQFGVFYLGSGLAAAAGNTAIGWVSGFGDRLASLVCVAIGLTSAVGVALLHRRGALTPSQPEAAR
ncbi:MFS transporter [Lentzea flaviverrucosa]|uniref:Predicted arabinose efflux permease, MFS family n=1 Tax=Lentzea flaviverrucosa TaxID=200379 RepID=A0A1H9HAG8_9PSEU|nr:MFS transporter [Lentzea flaviverrucosa]RDI34655.1 putative MFS family arabinose efflux permease [Lentzea flaviverrucosa]SEQ59238.1 Predicted arabinose efflux permease, MFS family [Lentzea flaviverrucosa]